MKSHVLKLKNSIKELEEMISKNPVNKKELKQKLKQLYTELKKEFKSCKESGHNFSEWEEIVIKNVNYSIPHYTTVTPVYPIYVRVCADCGCEEVRLTKPKETKNRHL